MKIWFHNGNPKFSISRLILSTSAHTTPVIIMFTKVLTTTCSGIAKIIRQLLKLKSFTIVVIKFIAVNIELISARCRLKIARSTEPPEWL